MMFKHRLYWFIVGIYEVFEDDFIVLRDSEEYHALIGIMSVVYFEMLFMFTVFTCEGVCKQWD